MKRETRKFVEAMVVGMAVESEAGVDILDSDKKQRATIRDLRAALRIAEGYMPAGPNLRRVRELGVRTPKGTKR